MTDPTPQRPQPVVNWSRATSAISGVVSAISTFLLITGYLSNAQVDQLQQGINAAVAAVSTIVAIVVPLIHGKRAAADVTPTVDPVSHTGQPLQTQEQWALEYGKHAPSYDKGGVLPPSSSEVVNNSGAAEQIQQGLDYARSRYASPTDRSASMGPDLPDPQPRTDYYAKLRANADPREQAATRRLGRLPNDPSKPRVRLTADMIPTVAYAPPPVVDYYSKVPANSWGMDGNDRVGDCTCAEVDHTTKARQVAAGNPEVKSSDAEVLRLYSQVTGYTPTNPNSDQGAMMQDVRAYWRKNGAVLGGKVDKILLFAQVDHTNLDLIKWCVDRFGAVGLGINFPASAMDQFDAGQPWDVVKGSPIKGGHAISMVGYDAQFAYVITWGKVQPMTWGFFRAYVEEAWTDLDESFVNAQSGNDPLGEVAYNLGEQFAQVTGQPNPFPTPTPQPPVPPTPPVPPAPAPLPAFVLKWAAQVIAEKWRSQRDKTVAQTILDTEAPQ